MIPVTRTIYRTTVFLLIAAFLTFDFGFMTRQFTSAQAGDSTALLDVRINQVTTNDQQEPTLSVDPANPNNIIAAAKDWRAGPKEVWNYQSTDAGKTWTDSHIAMPTELPNQSDPVVGFDATGRAYTAMIGYNQNDLSVGGIFVSASADGGSTWQQPVLVSPHSQETFNDKEWLTVDRSNNPATRGTIYVSWTLFTQITPRTQRGDIVVARSTDGGRTFSKHVQASLSTQGNCQGSYPVVGPNGELYVVYYSGQLSANDQEEARSGAVQQMTVPGQSQSSSGNALYVAKSTDGGNTFRQVARAADVVVPPSPLPGSSFRIFVLPALAVDQSTGALYAVWNDYRAGNADVLVVRSTDGGVTWNAPQRVNDDPTSVRHDQFFPTETVGSDGTLHVLWLDRRDDPNNLRFTPYYSRSTDGGLTFSANTPLSNVQSDPSIGFQGTLIGDYIALDTSADGSRVDAAWVDTRNGTQDIYFATFDAHNGPGPQPVPQLAAVPTPAAEPSPQPLEGFTEEEFRTRWERSDDLVLTGKADRSWTWGPVAFGAALEPYAQSKTGTREVLYFDKARMEINNPAADRSGPFFVTNGLLVVEMISGRIQIGDNQFDAARQPAAIPIAGDADSPGAPTYASLAPVASLSGDHTAPDLTGQAVTAVLSAHGQVHDDPARAGTIKLARYDTHIGHNIPDVFWTFMNETGTIYNSRFDTYSEGPILNWETDLGYPITEPYWVDVKVSGVPRSVLLQAFQRRVLTYVADNPPGWQVEMGNVGRQYFDWRYTKGR